MQTLTCQIGTIVRVTAGRDIGRFLVVTAADGKDLFLADGEGRSLSKPKRKNPKHVQATGKVIALAGMDDAALRRTLKPMQPQCVTKSRPNETRKEVIVDVEAGCH